VLPNLPGQLQNYIDSNLSVHSGSASSEVSRNNANLPDGWTIQIADDGKAWQYYNEYTGKSASQYPASPAAIVDHDTEILRDQSNINRDSFTTDQSNEEEIANNLEPEPVVKSSKEVHKVNIHCIIILLMCVFYSLWKIG
jgi:hypothetical protein